MAAPQWTGGKCKSVQQAKAFFRHNDKDRRLETQHANPHIDKAKTKDNFTYRGLTYKQLCKAFDDKLASVDVGRESSGKNARVVLQSVILYPPAALPREQMRDWLMDAGRVLEARYGDNLLEIQYDMDEEHWYTDPITKERRLSRHHGHARLFPEVDGKLNGKKFSSASAIKQLNQALDQMSVQKYGVPMMDGSGKKGRAPVENLKAASLRAEVEQLEERADVILTDALDAAADVRREAREDANGIRAEAKQLREQAKADWASAQLAMDDADEYAQATKDDADDYARRKKSQADQDAKDAKDAAQKEADRIKEQAKADAKKITDAAEQRAQEIQSQLREKMQRELSEATAEKDKAVNDRKAAVAALQGDYETWGELSSRPTAAGLLGVLGAAVEASRPKRPPLPSGVAGAYDRMMAMMGRTSGNAAPGPTAVEGPTM